MSDKLNELKATERELRTLVTEALNTTHTDDAVYIQRVYDYITKNEFIKPLVDALPCDKTEKLLVCSYGGSVVISAPRDKAIHLASIVSELKNLCERNNLCTDFFCFAGLKKFTDSIQSGLRSLITPLQTYLSTKLRDQIEEIERCTKMEIPTFGGDYVAGDKQQAGGDIISGDKNKKQTKTITKTNVSFYKKEGFISGVISGIISSLIVLGIVELIKFLIGV